LYAGYREEVKYKVTKYWGEFLERQPKRKLWALMFSR
jgi:hypothetical protein